MVRQYRAYAVPVLFFEEPLRIAVINANQSRVGGAETYINSLLPALVSRGHNIALGCECAEVPGRDPIVIPKDSPKYCIADHGPAAWLTLIREWAPDVLYVHGLRDWHVEEAVLEIAPALFYIHSYYGTCISGAKTYKAPSITPCQRTFGAACLAQFYPRRCGGLNPATMWQQYQIQANRLRLLSKYRAVLADSEHMVAEFHKHGITAQCLYLFAEEAAALEDRKASNAAQKQAESWRLLYLGRMDRLKGGEFLLDALPEACKRLGRKLQIVFAGSGPEEQRWKREAQRLQARCPGIAFEFKGWVDEQERSELLDRSDLFILPSLWPEPFGLGGIEAGLRYVPSVAFAAGGIPEWLTEGVNGCLASANPPTPDSLSQAIVRALKDPIFYRQLQHGARQKALAFKKDLHVIRLIEILKGIRCSSNANVSLQQD